MTDGSVLVEEVLTTRGGPERPLSFEEVSAKFTSNAQQFLSEPELGALAGRCHALGDLSNITELLAPLTVSKNQ